MGIYPRIMGIQNIKASLTLGDHQGRFLKLTLRSKELGNPDFQSFPVPKSNRVVDDPPFFLCTDFAHHSTTLRPTPTSIPVLSWSFHQASGENSPGRRFLPMTHVVQQNFGVLELGALSLSLESMCLLLISPNVDISHAEMYVNQTKRNTG